MCRIFRDTPLYCRLYEDALVALRKAEEEGDDAAFRIIGLWIQGHEAMVMEICYPPKNRKTPDLAP